MKINFLNKLSKLAPLLLIKYNKGFSHLNFTILAFVVFFGTSLPFSERLQDSYEAETSNPLNQFIFIYLFISIIIIAIRDPKPLINLLKKLKFLTIFFLIALVSFLWSDHPFISFKRSFQLIVTFLTIINAVAILPEKKIVFTLVLVGFFYSLISIFSCLFIPDAIDPAFGTWRGLELSKNGLGYNALILLIIGFYSQTIRNNTLYNTIGKLLIFFSVLLIIFAFSTTNILGMLTIFFILILNKFKSLFHPLGIGNFIFNTALIFIIIFSIILSFFSKELIASIPGLFGKDTSLTGRDVIWLYLLNEFFKKPILGYGYGTYWIMGTYIIDLFTANVGWRVNEAHNGFLEILLQLGITGFTFFALTIISFIKKTIQYNDSIALISIVSILIVNMSESFIFSPRDPSTLLFILLYARLINNYSRYIITNKLK